MSARPELCSSCSYFLMTDLPGKLVVLGLNLRAYDASNQTWNIKWLNALNGTWMNLSPSELGGVKYYGQSITYALMFGAVRDTIIQGWHSLSLRPMCRQGKCKPRDYVLVDSTPEKAVFRCRCGDLYLSKGGHFSQILPDRSLLPYMVRDSSRNWKADTARPTS